MGKRVGTWILATALVLSSLFTAPGNEAQAARKMKLSKTSLNMKVGDKKKLTVKKYKGSVKWSTSKKKIATVSKKGLVTAKKKGKATITAKVKQNGKSKKLKCKVTVVNKKKDNKKSDAPAKSPLAAKSSAPASPSPSATNADPVSPSPSTAATSPSPSTAATSPSPSTAATSPSPSAAATSSSPEEEEYEISGTLSSAEGDHPADVAIGFTAGRVSYETMTDSQGKYRINLPAGKYKVTWNSYKVDEVTITGANANCDINAAAMHRVTGTLKRFGAAWANTDFIFENSSVTNTFTTDAAGNFRTYLPIGQYDLWLGNAEKEDREAALKKEIPLRFESGAETLSVDSDLVKVSGRVKHGANGIAGEYIYFCADDTDDRNTGCKTRDDGSFIIYLKGNTAYRCFYEEDIEVGTLETGERDMTDVELSMDLVHVTGTLKSASGEGIPDVVVKFTDSQNRRIMFRTDEKGAYSAYAKPGTYSVTIQGFAEMPDSLVVQETDLRYDINTKFHKLSGKVTVNGNDAANQNFHVTSKAWDVEETATEYNTDSAGRYTVFMPDGDYTFQFIRIPSAEISVNGADKEQDIELSCYHVRGNMYYCEGKKFSDNEIRMEVRDDKDEYLTSWYTTNSAYELYLKNPGTYHIKSGDIEYGSITVTEKESIQDVTANLFRVAGEVKNVPIEDYAFLNIFSDEYSQIDCWTGDMIEGTRMPYEVYLPAGKYTVDINGERSILNVSGDMPEKDFVLRDRYPVNLTIKYLNGVAASLYYDVSGEGMSTQSRTDEEGKTKNLTLPAGTYKISTDYGEENVTVEDRGVDGEITLNALLLRGRLLGRDGTPKEYETVWLKEKNSSPMEGGKNTWTDESGNFTIALEPGKTYDVFARDMQKNIGEVTATAENLKNVIDFQYTEDN